MKLACIASIAVHATAIAAFSWLRVDAATAPATGAVYIDLAYLHAAAPDRASEASTGPLRSEPPPLSLDRSSVGPSGHTLPQIASMPALKTARKSNPPGRTPDSGPENEKSVSAPVTENQLLAVAANSSIAETLGSGPANPIGPIALETGTPSSSVELALTHVVEPIYPRTARRLGHEGRVVIQATILPSGKVASTQVIESSGFVELDQSAQRAAEKSRFATTGLPSIGATKELVFRFILEEDS